MNKERALVLFQLAAMAIIQTNLNELNPAEQRADDAEQALLLERQHRAEDLPTLPAHEFRELVNDLREVATTHAATQSLRESISRVLSKYVKPGEVA